MTIKLNITLTNTWLYSLITIIILLIFGVGVFAYQTDISSGNAQIFGHSAGEINVLDSSGKVINLQSALNNLQNIIRETYEIKGNELTGLTPNKKYVVNVYGITTNRGTGGATLNPIGVKVCNGATLSKTLEKRINWHDGNAPQSASFIITAPPSGCIQGFTDGEVLYMSVFSI